MRLDEKGCIELIQKFSMISKMLKKKLKCFFIRTLEFLFKAPYQKNFYVTVYSRDGQQVYRDLPVDRV